MLKHRWSIGLLFLVIILGAASGAFAVNVPEGHNRLHYHRYDSDYQGWGLHVWGRGYAGNPVSWTSPLEISGFDQYGAYWDIPYNEGAGDLNFIIHRGDDKDPEMDRVYPRPDQNKQIWAVTGSETAYHSAAEAIEAMEGSFVQNTVSLKDIGIKKLTIGDAEPVKEGTVRLYYHRFDHNYTGWGLHVWGKGYAGTPVLWTEPLPITGMVDYGAYWDIPYKEGVGDLNFIIHKGDQKDPQPDRVYPEPDQYKEVWAVSGDETAYVDPVKAVQSAENKVVQAVIISKNEVKIEFRNQIKEAIFIRDGYNYIPVAKLDTAQAPLYTVTTRTELDLSKNYRIESGAMSGDTRLSPELIDLVFAYSGQLGAIYTKDSTTFKLWAPLASRVSINLYQRGDCPEPEQVEELSRTARGVWTIKIKGDLAGKFYQYSVSHDGQEKTVLDPYARSMAAFNSNGPDKVGRAAVVDLEQTNPVGWSDDNYVRLPVQEDVIIYEMSVRDFTISADSGVAEEKRGTYLGFIEKIPHLVDLGVTHLQLMPVLNFYYGNEYDRSFEEGGSAGEANYNWGYDPHNYFTPEGWFSLEPADPHLRIKELKTLIKALHDAGIGVVLDVVYNHTAKTSTFEDIVPGYYYRQYPDGSYSSGSGCGNDTASKRAMMRKLIIDSASYWVQEYHIDGFRFDLMGLHDETTMVQVTQAIRAINPEALLHGEGWNMNTLLPVQERYIKGDNHSGKRSLLEYDQIAAVFSDTIRDGIIQPSAFAPAEEGGFVQGVVGNEAKVRTGVIASLVNYQSEVPLLTTAYDRFADDPEEVINYVTCHDGRTLWDKLTLSAPTATVKERKRMHKLATAIVMTAQGKAFIHGGSEMLRSKPDPDNQIHGFDHNSYDSGDLTNQLIWKNKDEHREIYQYFKGLIKLRREQASFRLETMEEIQKQLEFIPIEEANLVAFRLRGAREELIVIYNSNRIAKTLAIAGIDPGWQVLVDGEKAGVSPLPETEVILSRDSITVPAIAAVVIKRDQDGS